MGKITSASVIAVFSPKGAHSEGAFLARQENATFHTYGLRLNEGRLNALTDDEVIPIMNDVVKRPEVLAFAARRRGEEAGKIPSEPSTLTWEAAVLAAPLTMAEARKGLALTFGVAPNAIEITIRG
jgi:hypothetical protein